MRDDANRNAGPGGMDEDTLANMIKEMKEHRAAKDEVFCKALGEESTEAFVGKSVYIGVD